MKFEDQLLHVHVADDFLKTRFRQCHNITMFTVKRDRKGEPFGTSHVIQKTCNEEKSSKIFVMCKSFPKFVKEDDKMYLKLSSKEQKWNIWEAEEVGFHIGSCEASDTKECFYWYIPKDGNYLQLSSEPITRFKFNYIGIVQHEKVFGGEVIKGGAYQIEAIDVDDEKRFVGYKVRLRTWLSMREKPWNFWISPKL